MSTRYDVLEAKAQYDNHLETHRCGLLQRCPDRHGHWRKWLDTAARWGQEYDDNERQRRQFFDRYPNSLPTSDSERRFSR